MKKRQKYTLRYAQHITKQVVNSDLKSVATRNNLTESEVESMINQMSQSILPISLKNLKRLGIDEISREDFRFTNAEINGLFSFNLQSAIYILQSFCQLDFESDPDLDILVQSTDSGGLSVEKILTVNLIDDRDFDVVATEGDDLINSGTGGQVTMGLGGQDTFIYDSINDFGDIITDFNPNNDDLINLTSLYSSYTAFGYDLNTILGENPFENLVNVTSIGNNNSQISLSPYGQLLPDYQVPLAILEGVTPNQIDATHFLFS